ncbi:hypothetical protein D3C84_981490 [compost metagenome]
MTPRWLPGRLRRCITCWMKCSRADSCFQPGLGRCLRRPHREQARSHRGMVSYTTLAADTVNCGSELARDGGITGAEVFRAIRTSHSHRGNVSYTILAAGTVNCGSELARDGGITGAESFRAVRFAQLPRAPSANPRPPNAGVLHQSPPDRSRQNSS